MVKRLLVTTMLTITAAAAVMVLTPTAFAVDEMASPAPSLAAEATTQVTATTCAQQTTETAIPSQPPSTDATGVIAGRYLQQLHDGSQSSGVFGVTIGVFLEELVQGPEAPNPPEPIVTSTTGADGSFAFQLAAGRYFLTTIGEIVYTQGSWVDVISGQTTEAQIIGCLDCPPMM